MSHAHPHRRQFLVATAGGVGLATVGGGALYVTNAQGQADYEMALQEEKHMGSAMDPLRQMVRYATMAANSHNTQPWRFIVSARSILVLPDLKRRLTAVDPDNHHLFVSLGCAVENIVQAAAALGYAAQPAFDKAAGGIAIAMEKSKVQANDLFAAVAQRQSTRSDYDGKPVPLAQMLLLEAAGNGPGVQMRLFAQAQQREDILSYLVEANSAQIDDKAFMRELKSWIRFNYADAVSTGDGLFSKCTGNPVMPGWFGRAIFPYVFTKNTDNAKYQSQLRSSAGVAVFIGEKSAPEFWVEVGRCCQRFALQATALHIRTAFINQPVEVPAVRGQFATWLGIGERRPDLVMRFGYGPLMPRSLRRPLGQVISEN